jgi:2-polyprenyl-3-methyl-5-hydroxy-6-metoxy-1,4-benzoquinol methylase
MTALTERLDAIARTYDTTEDFDRCSIEFERELIAEAARGLDLLEVGCGWGDMTEYFASRFRRIAALDGSLDCVCRTRQRCRLSPHVEVHHTLIEEFRTEERFEDVVMVRVLEHLEDPVGTLARLASFLKPGGQLHLIVPNARSLHRRIGKAMGLLRELNDFSPRDIQYGHQRVYDSELLTQHLEAAGLRVAQAQGVLIKSLSNAQMQSWDPAVIRALFAVGKEEPGLCNELYFRAVTGA